MLPRAEQKQQTRHALLDAARQLMASGRGFASISLREVAKAAGIVPTGFYRHFADMDELGLALVREVGETFRESIRTVRTNEFVMEGLTDASVRIFLDVVAANHSQFLFLAREQYGGSRPVRQALAALREGISSDLADDLARMPRWQHLDRIALAVMADQVVKTVFATLPELIDPPEQPALINLSPQAKIVQQLRFIFLGATHWPGPDAPE
ncbi:TetR family transcriptional regulator [Pseudomonas sp. nanlin1]|uniref:TetR family transcriptional regulator n=1 Tax=Pseudomonas sp. nanlin1 TaxID=3040605 RepID=UPI00388E80EA